ncbi:hypothetical protein N7495_002587 [Penicillium taxi]|uniref:uncharacterized protein n=1 Tax=Penicillium taxi TaxID=168475 RepID=UPI0025455688|nr:uncharacterized protein N7495_002587 [Penicillium taxi]KAJ5902059.1 hypothetical protein N7495_002587 [Penicillium taxi]
MCGTTHDPTNYEMVGLHWILERKPRSSRHWRFEMSAFDIVPDIVTGDAYKKTQYRGTRAMPQHLADI